MRNIAVALVLVLLLPVAIFAQSSSSSAGSTAASNAATAAPATTASANTTPANTTPATTAPATTAAPAKPVGPTPEEIAAKRRDILRFGLDSEVVELLQTLSGEKEKAFNAEIADLFGESRNAKTRQAVLALFGDLEDKRLEKTAVELVKNRDREDSGLVQSALLYLGVIRSKSALDLAPDLLKEDNRKLLPALLKLLGRAGGAEEETILLKWLESDAPTEELRQGAVQALGDIGSGKAVEKLDKIVEDTAQPKATRMYACDALAKIGDRKAIPSLVIAANGEDPNVRAQAVTALASFKGDEAATTVLSGLRDASLLVRVAACKGCAKLRLDKAIPALIYRSGNDPEKSVKTEAMRALAEIGGKEAFAWLSKTLEDPKAETASRVLAFSLLMRKDPSSLAALETRLVAEAKEKDRSLYTAFAREIANAQDAPGLARLARVLLSDSDYLIRVAALDWARKNKPLDFKAELAKVAETDPSDYMRRRATETLAAYGN